MKFEFQDYSHLLDALLEKTQGLILNSPLVCDHICYRVETKEQYLQTKKELQNIASLYEETNVRGRLISIYKLNTPLKYRNLTIDCVELPEPKDGSFYKNGWEHAELVVPNLQEVLDKNPHEKFKTKGLARELNPEIALKINESYSVKFHPLHILEVIDKERELGLKEIN